MKIACLQTNPGNDRHRNINEIISMMEHAVHSGSAQLIVLPEVFSYMGDENGRLDSANDLDEGIFEKIADTAKKLRVHVVAGSHAEKSKTPGKVFNTAVSYSSEGTILNIYRKIHLFNLRDSSGQPLYCESQVLAPGKEISGFDIPVGENSWRALTAICYDVRFPELFRTPETKINPYDVIFLPAAFTYQTGLDHWEVLLRARAIENQCYVVACNQTGFHSEGRKRNFGNSMVIDPWGKIVAQLGEESGVLCAELSLSEVKNARTKLPALADRAL